MNGEVLRIVCKMLERLTIRGQTMKKNLNPSGRLTRIQGLLPRSYDKADRGQDRQGKGRQNGSKLSWRTLTSAVSLVGIANLALVGVLSRSLFIQKTVLSVPDPNPLPYFQGILNNKMSVIELNTLTNHDIKKWLLE